MQLSATVVIVLTFLASVLGAPVPLQELDQRSSDLEVREPVQFMNIQLHKLNEQATEPGLDDQRIMNIVKHSLREMSPEEETELERRVFDKSLLRIGIPIL